MSRESHDSTGGMEGGKEKRSDEYMEGKQRQCSLKTQRQGEAALMERYTTPRHSLKNKAFLQQAYYIQPPVLSRQDGLSS